MKATHQVKLSGLLLLLPCLGCLAAAAAGAGGIYYTVSNVAYKTFPADQSRVRDAALQALGRMGFELVGSKRGEDKEELYAKSEKLDLEVTLDRVSSGTTKVEVNAKKDVIRKDKSVAKAVLVEMSRILGVP